MFDDKKDREIINYVKKNEDITIAQLTNKFDIDDMDIWKVRELLFQNGVKLKKKDVLFFTDEDVIDRFKDGFTIRDLTLMYSVSSFIIKDVLLNAGIDFSNKMFSQRDDKIVGYTEDDIKFLYDKGYSATDISKKFRAKREDICKILNIPVSSGKRPLFWGGD